MNPHQSAGQTAVELPNQPHAQAVATLLTQLETGRSGLSMPQASLRLALFGPNRLPTTPPEHWLRRLLRQFHNILIYVLLAAALVTAVLGYWVDMGVILAVVLINAGIGFIQEGKAEQALASIRHLLSPQAQALRDGHWQRLPATELVPGDLVKLRAGDRVPADLRLLEATGLLVEEAALTGESVPVRKQPEPVAATTALGDRSCMAYAGTLVSTGQGLGLVTATGTATELGQISTLLATVETLATPLTRQMNHFGRWLAAGILLLAGGMMLMARTLHQQPLDELFFAAIGFAVAAIPEGLPAILSITLALGVQRMAYNQAITKRMDAVETLGAVTLICADKTGTLTRNEMTARHLCTRAGTYEVTGTGYAPQGDILRDGKPVALSAAPDLQALIQALAVCNDAALHQQEGHWRLSGDPTEGALRTLGLKAGFAHQPYQRLALLPFASEHKFMAVQAAPPAGQALLLVKGAPDRLLALCPMQLGAQGAPEPLAGAWWEAQIQTLSSQGLRVLAAASALLPDTGSTGAPATLSPETLQQLPAPGLCLLGLVGIMDPPRPEAIRAIADCRAAGIGVKMITGDHAGTAIAIGREMGLGPTPDTDPSCITGAELEQASDAALADLAQAHQIFARTSPRHKLRIVQALQARGQVVAMTGDGVNDAPALKRADVGIAMGIKGSEAAKEAADMVLADDNFASIAQAVREGRKIFDNLQKAVLFILPTNGAQALVILAAVLAGVVLPLSPVQILWINMVTAVTLALALAFEPAEANLMRRPPRDPAARMLGGLLLWRVLLVSLVIGGATAWSFTLAFGAQASLELARTQALNTLVICQVFYLFSTRVLHQSAWHWRTWYSNPVAWLAVGVLALLQALLVYHPGMNHWFGTAPMASQHWLGALAAGVGVFVLVELEKWVLRFWRRRS